MYQVELNSFELMDVQSASDPTHHVRVGFPLSSAHGSASTAAVLFEIEPGDQLGRHTDSAEEILLVLAGTGRFVAGDQETEASAGTMLVCPAMVPHSVHNTGEETLRVLGLFSSSTVVSTFDEPPAPGGPQLFVIGAPFEVALPLPETTLVA